MANFRSRGLDSELISVQPLDDNTSLIGNSAALRERWNDDGVLFLRGVMDLELIGWARDKYRAALAGEGLIDPAN